MQLVKNNAWLPFLVLGLVAQQANMLTYKFGGQAALPYVFLAYSFVVQCFLNLILTAIFKNKGFPIIFKPRMRLWALLVAAIYVVNETLFISIYGMSAPYGLMMTIFALMGVVIMTFVGLVFLKEKVSLKQFCGIILAVIAIAMVKLG